MQVTDSQKLDGIMWMLVELNRKADQIMSGLSKLNVNVAQEGTDITALLAEWQTFLSDMQATLAGDDPDTAVAAAAALVAAQDAQVKQLTAAMQAADTVTGTDCDHDDPGAGRELRPHTPKAPRRPREMGAAGCSCLRRGSGALERGSRERCGGLGHPENLRDERADRSEEFGVGRVDELGDAEEAAGDVEHGPGVVLDGGLHVIGDVEGAGLGVFGVAGDLLDEAFDGAGLRGWRGGGCWLGHGWFLSVLAAWVRHGKEEG